MSDAHVIHEPAGTITVAPSVLAQVVHGIVGQIDGARVRRGRRSLAVEVGGDDRARVTLELAVRYGTVLPDLAEDVQRRVAEGLRTMCGLDAGGIDVAIEEVDG